MNILVLVLCWPLVWLQQVALGQEHIGTYRCLSCAGLLGWLQYVALAQAHTSAGKDGMFPTGCLLNVLRDGSLVFGCPVCGWMCGVRDGSLVFGCPVCGWMCGVRDGSLVFGCPVCGWMCGVRDGSLVFGCPVCGWMCGAP